MLDWLLGNLHYKLAALLVALAAWVYVQSDEIHDAPLRIPVEWTLATGLVPVGALPQHVTLQVEGTRAMLRRARRAEIALVADIRDVGPGQHALEFASMPMSGLDAGLVVRGYAPSGVRFTLDRVSERRVEVLPKVVGTPVQGFAVESVTVTPAVVSIRGASALVEGLARVSTEPIDISGLDRRTEQPAALDLPNGVEPAELVELRAEIDILALNEQRTFTEVPVHVWNVPGVRATPSTAQVVLRGPAATLRELAVEDVTVFVHPGEQGSQTRVRVLHAGGAEVESTSIVPESFALERR